MTVDEYREKVLKAMLDYEKQFDPVDQYEITDAIGELYEIIRSIGLTCDKAFADRELYLNEEKCSKCEYYYLCPFIMRSYNEVVDGD